MNVVWVRRALFTLAPVELVVAGLILGGVSIPAPVRWTVLGLIVGTLLLEAIVWIRAYRFHRRTESVRRSAVVAMEQVVGARLWSVMAAEFAMVGSLARWIRRQPEVPAGAQAFTYHRQGAPIMWTMVGLIAVETAALHLVVPWPTVRLVLVILSLYSLLWVTGFIAGFTVHPHLLRDRTLILRHGPRVSITIPTETITEITLRNGDLPGIRSVRYEEPSESTGDGVLHIAHAGSTNTVISLATSLPGSRLTGNMPVTQVRAWVDEPRSLKLGLQALGPNISH